MQSSPSCNPVQAFASSISFAFPCVASAVQMPNDNDCRGLAIWKCHHLVPSAVTRWFSECSCFWSISLESYKKFNSAEKKKCDSMIVHYVLGSNSSLPWNYNEVSLFLVFKGRQSLYRRKWGGCLTEAEEKGKIPRERVIMAMERVIGMIMTQVLCT